MLLRTISPKIFRHSESPQLVRWLFVSTTPYCLWNCGATSKLTCGAETKWTTWRQSLGPGHKASPWLSSKKNAMASTWHHSIKPTKMSCRLSSIRTTCESPTCSIFYVCRRCAMSWISRAPPASVSVSCWNAFWKWWLERMSSCACSNSGSYRPWKIPWFRSQTWTSQRQPNACWN